ncbi:unnamed protein product [Danaus chrysippus]|uniref:(African queen) hypothetical protein n=1 Tax=Danaus chrysippus TaxID=151541 RepID=A0A8J2QZ90_9NEOP|nr:unnamed protein product [Danaus chrysippus]
MATAALHQDPGTTPLWLASSTGWTVPTTIVSALSTVEVFTRNPGHGLYDIPRRIGSLLNFAIYTLRPTEVCDAHPRDKDAPDRSCSSGAQRR